MTAPDRLALPSCIGCGAIATPGTCATGCVEERLELVPGGAHDLVAAAERSASAAAAAFRGVVETLASGPTGDGAEAWYRERQAEARTVLRAHPLPDELTPADTAEVWWCPACGAVDGPQPCLGICVWRVLEWVPAARDVVAHEAAAVARARALDLRAPLRTVAAATPRAGHWDDGAVAAAAAARGALTAEP